jgi:hypothetical protein
MGMEQVDQESLILIIRVTVKTDTIFLYRNVLLEEEQRMKYWEKEEK